MKDSEIKTPKLTDWKNEPSISDLDSDLKGGSSSRLSQVAKIDDWLDLLNVDGKYKPNKRAGRSSVQPRLAKKQASWRYAALADPFLNSGNTFEIKPRTFRDRKAAYENELVLNYQFNVLMDKVKFINEYVHTAVDQGTVIVKLEWMYEERVVTKELPVYNYSEVADPMVAMNIMEAIKMQEEDPDQFLQLPDDIQESVLATAENGRPILATITEWNDTEVIEVVKDQPYWSVCDYRNITIDPTCQGDFSKAQFVIHSYETSISELRKNPAYTNLDNIQLPDQGNGDHTSLENGGEGTTFLFQDAARKKVVVYEYWGFWDIHDDGKTVPIVAAWVGNTMIRMEENPIGDLPFEVVSYEPESKSVYGVADADLLYENQAIIGALTRGMIDSLARCANAQVGLRKDALDTVNKKKYLAGDNYEFNPSIGDSRSAIIEHSFPELPSSTFNMLTMFNAEAEATTGTKSWTGGDANLGNTAAAVNGVLSAAAKRELDILRRLSSGLERIARKTLKMNAVFLSDEAIIRVTDEQFVNINRDNLQGSFDVVLSISTAESDNIKAQELSFMLQTMGGSLPFELTKLILSEISRLRNMPDLSKQLLEYQPQPDPMQQLEVQAKQLELQKLQIELQKLQADAQLSQAKAQAEAVKVGEIQAKTAKLQLDTVEQELGVTQERELEKMRAQAESNMNRDILNKVVETATKSKGAKGNE